MSELHQETVTSVHHWTDRLFTFRTTRDSSLRFRNGEFTMVGIEVDGKPLLRAYSMTSANYEEFLEFYSIKVPDGPLTSRLQHIKVGDKVYVSKKPTGSLLWDHLRPGRHLYLLSTGTGLAPFLSVIKDPDIYENFEKVILAHGCRYINELTYETLITHELQHNEFFGDSVQSKLIYYPAVTRERFRNFGRLNTLIESGRLVADIGLPALSVEDDRFMVCGGPHMLKTLSGMLADLGFGETRRSDYREFVVERAFVDK